MMLASLGEKGLLIGLSEENIKRLKEDKPILQDSPMGQVVIMYGKSEFEIVNRLKKEGLINENTEMKTKGVVK